MDVVTLKKAVKDAGKYTDQEVSALEAFFADSQIIEQGSNENGEYIRWENGLQMCFARITVDLDVEISDVFFPSSFANINAASLAWVNMVNATHRASARTVLFGVQTDRWKFWVGQTLEEVQRPAYAFAIGRWK